MSQLNSTKLIFIPPEATEENCWIRINICQWAAMESEQKNVIKLINTRFYGIGKSAGNDSQLNTALIKILWLTFSTMYESPV